MKNAPLFLLIFFFSKPCLGQTNNLDNYLRVIDSCIENKSYTLALKYADEVLQKDTNNTTILWSRAIIYSKLGLLEKALKDKEHIATIEPNDAFNWCGAAWYALLLNQKELGLKYANKAFVLKTSHYKIPLMMAHAYTLLEQVEESHFYYTMAAEYLPNKEALEDMKNDIDTLVAKKVFPYSKKTAESLKKEFANIYVNYSKNELATNYLDTIEYVIHNGENEYSARVLDLKSKFYASEVTNTYSRYFVLRDFLWHLGEKELDENNIIKARDFYFYKSISLSIELKDTPILVKQLFKMGSTKIEGSGVKNIRNANDYLDTALRISYISKKIKHGLKINILKQLSGNYAELNVYDTAVFYAKQSFEEAKKDTSNILKSITANLVSLQYSAAKQFDSAVYYYKICKQYVVKESVFDRFTVDKNFCIMLSNSQNYKLSYKYSKAFIEEYKKYNNEIDISELYECSGNVLFYLNKMDDAEVWCKKAIETYKEWLNNHLNNDMNATPSKERLLSFRRLKKIIYKNKKTNNEDLFSIAEQSKANIFYSSLTGKNYPTNTVSLKELQGKLLDDEVIISPSINDDIDCAYIMAISKKEIKTIKLDFENIDKLVDTFKLSAWKPAINSVVNYLLKTSTHSNDTSKINQIKKLGTLSAIVTWFNSSFTVNNTSRSTFKKDSSNSKSYYKEFQEKSIALLYHFFIHPIEDMLQGKSKIIFLQEQFTSLMPFESLTNQQGKYLGELYNIIYQPSATVNSLMEARKSSSSFKKILAIGNPNYSSFHPKETGKAYDLSKLGYGEWMDLPGTQKELQAIKKTVLNCEAVEQNKVHELWLKKQSENGEVANNYDIIHFALHGLYSPNNFEENALIITDSTGTKEDGFLLFSEIMNLKINAKLVTLSACETAKGVPSADVAPNLITAFIMAGAQGVIGTSWKIDDDATALFMKHFYTLVYNKNMGITIALMETRRAFINGVYGDKFKNPYYWAAFKYTGINQ